MENQSFFIFLSLFLLISSSFILLKLYFFDSFFSRNILSDYSKTNGYSFIDPLTITSDIYPVKIIRSGDTSEKVVQAILKEEDERFIYFLNIEKKTFHPKGGYVLDYYSVAIVLTDTIIFKEVKIFPKINNFIHSRFEQNDKEIILLDPDFLFSFNVFSEKDYIIVLPKLLQIDLLFFKSDFPLSDKKSSITPVITLNSSSIFIVSSRVSSLNELDSVFNLLNIVEANVV